MWDVNAPYRLMRVTAFRDVYSLIPPTTLAPNVILTGMAAQLWVRIWYRGPEMLNGRTDEEKFNEDLSFIARTDEQRQSLKSLIARIQCFMPLLQESGLVVFYSDREVETVKPLFEARG